MTSAFGHDAEQIAREGAAAALSGASAGSLLDPAVLGRLATDLYHELEPALHEYAAASTPESEAIFRSYLPLSEEIAAQSLAASTAYAPYLMADAAALENVASLTSLPADLPASPGAPVPGVPGGLSGALYGSESSFGFLAEARPLFDEALQLASDFSIEAFHGIGTTTRLSEAAMPLVAGSVEPALDWANGLYAGFLSYVRPLESPAAAWSNLVTGGVAGANAIPAAGAGGFDANAVRRDFPILSERVEGRPLIWLDNAATTQKPRAVIERLSYFYEHENSNVHRGAHTLAARSTDAYEAARQKVAGFLNASSPSEIIFVRGTTEAINLVSQSWGRANIGEGDEILITWLEHHANIVPWQMLCEEKGARLRVAPVDDDGQVIVSEFQKLLGPRTKLVSLAHVSNALGTIVPVQELTSLAHRTGARVLVDGAQAVSHMPVDVDAIGCDFYVFSGHKVFGPTGIGVVYGRSEVLENTPPWQGGGNMIADVTFTHTRYQQPPVRFEAGTANIAGAVGLGAAIDYVQRLGMPNIARYEHDLLVYATEGLRRVPGLHIIGNAPEKAGVLSFVLDGFATEQVGQALAREGVAVRAGHHCAQPILRRFGLESTVRPSLAMYNTCADIDALVAALWRLKAGRGPGPF